MKYLPLDVKHHSINQSINTCFTLYTYLADYCYICIITFYFCLFSVNLTCGYVSFIVGLKVLIYICWIVVSETIKPHFLFYMSGCSFNKLIFGWSNEKHDLESQAFWLAEPYIYNVEMINLVNSLSIGNLRWFPHPTTV